MTIINPSQEHIKGLKRIWKSVFGDTDYYVELFFEYNFSAERALICIENSTPVSMLYFPQYYVRFFDKIVKSGYICGAATLPEYRGQGIMSEMLYAAFDKMSVMGDTISVLIPASDSLYGYYSRFGYSECFYRNRAVFRRNDKVKSSVSFSNAESAKDIYPLYRKLTDSIEIAVLHNEKSMTPSVLDYKKSGGEVLIINQNKGYCYAFYSNNKVHVKELLSEKISAAEMASAMFDRYPDAESVIIETPANDNDTSVIKTGMARLIDEKSIIRSTALNCKGIKPYMNMMMD